MKSMVRVDDDVSTSDDSVDMDADSTGVPLIASPINCGALCMLISLAIVPLVSLVTPAVPFQIKGTSRPERPRSSP